MLRPVLCPQRCNTEFRPELRVFDDEEEETTGDVCFLLALVRDLAHGLCHWVGHRAWWTRTSPVFLLMFFFQRVCVCVCVCVCECV